MSYVVHTIGSRLATRAFPRCRDSKGGGPFRRSSTLCTYVLLRIGNSFRLIDINSKQSFTFQLVLSGVRTRTTLVLSSCLLLGK